MDEIIRQLDIVRNALGTLNIVSNRNNLDTLLGSMQILDRVIYSLQQKNEKEKQEGQEESE